MERNYKEDQLNEIEALESIYCGDMESKCLLFLRLKILVVTLIIIPHYLILVLETEPFHKFRIPIQTEEFNTEDQSDGLACKLTFKYTAKYPDEAPEVEVEDAINFEDDNLDLRLVEHIQETVSENTLKSILSVLILFL